MVPKESVQLNDFGIWLLAALRVKGIRILDSREEKPLNEAFVKAYQVIHRGLDAHLIRFVIILDPIYQTSGRVNELMNYWLMSTWVTRDSPGTIWRIDMSKTAAEQYLNEDALGGRELWLEAADAFIRQARP